MSQLLQDAQISDALKIKEIFKLCQYCGQEILVDLNHYIYCVEKTTNFAYEGLNNDEGFFS